MLALGDIHHGPPELNHPAQVVANGVGDTENVSYRTVRKNDPVVVFGVVPLVKLDFDQSDRGSIVRMHPVQEALRGWRCSIWIEAKNLKSFDRPENPFGVNLPSPTSCMTKPLRFR